jgi:hypothetical protein
MRLLGEHLDERVLTSHCLDRAYIELLRSSRWREFLEDRATTVAGVIYDHVQSHALFGFRDGPDVTALFEDAERD